MIEMVVDEEKGLTRVDPFSIFCGYGKPNSGSSADDIDIVSNSKCRT